MNRLAAIFLTLTAGMVLVLGSIVGDNSANAQKKKIRGRLPTYWRQLGLSKDQVTKVYKIQADYGAKVKALQDQIKQLNSEEKGKLLEVLTDNQKKRLREIYLKKAGFDPLAPKEKDKSPKDKGKKRVGAP